MAKSKTKLQNEKEYPKVYYARHMCQGVVGYQAEEGINVLVKNDTIKAMCPSFEGKPVYVRHQSVDLENLKNDMDGVVVNSFYNEADGWFWLKMIAITDECHEAIRDGLKVSNAYYVNMFGEGGAFLNVPYDKEVLAGEFNHLAIVEQPRYEDAIIMTPDEFKDYNEAKEVENKNINNSKNTKKGKIMFKLFKKTPVEQEIDETSFVTLENGTEVSVKDMINAVEEKAKEEYEKEKENKKNEADEDMTIEVNGKNMKISELVKEYENLCKKNKKNESEEEEDDKEKENETSEEIEKKEKDLAEKKEKKENEKKQFEELKNSIKNNNSATLNYETTSEKIKRGKERY